jgi:hypothetical protein
VDALDGSKKDLEKLIRKAKEDTLRVVEKTFMDLERSFEEQLDCERQKTGLHNRERLETIFSEITHQCLEVTKYLQDLGNGKGANLIKQINNEFLVEGTALREQISKEVTQNEMFKLDISYRPSMVYEI